MRTAVFVTATPEATERFPQHVENVNETQSTPMLNEGNTQINRVTHSALV